MKPGLINILLFLLLAFTTLTSNVNAGIPQEIWRSSTDTGLTANANPYIHGMLLVWQARGGLAGAQSGTGDQEIFALNLETMQLQQITDDNSDDISPQNDGRYVVWQKNIRGSGSSIYLYDTMYGGASNKISPDDSASHFAPAINQGYVVWTSQKVDSVYRAGKIWLYNAEDNSTPRVISPSQIDCSNPDIYRNKVVWTQDTLDGTLRTSQEWQYDLNLFDPVPEPARPWRTIRRSPSTDGVYHVFAQSDGTDREIFLFGPETGRVQLTDNDQDDSRPAISQNHVAWLSGNDVVVADISDLIAVTGINTARVRSTEFILRWKRIFQQGIDDYRMDLSMTPDFRIPVPGYIDRSLGNRSYYRIRGLRPDTTYYFRMRAVVNGSTTAYSRVGSVKTRPRHDTRSWWRIRLSYIREHLSQQTTTFRSHIRSLLRRISSLFRGLLAG